MVNPLLEPSAIGDSDKTYISTNNADAYYRRYCGHRWRRHCVVVARLRVVLRSSLVMISGGRRTGG